MVSDSWRRARLGLAHPAEGMAADSRLFTKRCSIGSMTLDRRSFLLAASGAMLPGCASIGGESGPPAAAPVYRVGDRWVYSARDGFRLPVTWDETHEVIAIDAQGIAIRVTQKGETVDNTRIERLSAPGIVVQGALFDSETRRFKTPLTRYQFPLTPGTHWNQFIGNYDESTKQDGQINNYASVRGWEKVRVPSGEFDAIILRVFNHLDDETFWRYATACNYEIWWSPAAGASVRENKFATYREKNQGTFVVEHRSQNTVLELTSFRRAT